MKVKYKVTVKGLVQGVGYRYFCRNKAMEYGITGFAKNNINGNVDLVIEGEKNLVNDFLKHLKIGPMHASVSSVVIEELKYDNEFDVFEIL